MNKMRHTCHCPNRGNDTFLRLLQPIYNESVFFLFAVLLPMLPDFIYSFSREMTFVVWRTLILSLFLSLFRAYILTVPLCFLSRQGQDQRGFMPPRAFQPIYRTFVLLFLGVASFAESFLQLQFGTLCSSSIIQVLWETDQQESAGFLKAYCTSSSFIGLSLLFLLLIAIYTILRRRAYNFEIQGKRFRWLLMILLLFGVIVSTTRIQVFCELVARRQDTPELTAPSTPISTYERIHTALSGNNFSPERAERLLEVLESAAVEGCTRRSSCVVLILGESFNKYHSSLYGYRQKTNPRLEERQQRGELLVFHDVITPANLTTSVLNQIFSPSSIDSKVPWDESPLFPALFKKAGYATYHIDNQTAGTVTNFHDLGVKNMFNSRSTPLLFTARNHQRHPLDLAVVNEYNQTTPRTDSAELTIFHLMGQHIYYNDRFPAEQAHFTPDDYPRDDLKQRQKQILADYDNATLYNDLVIDSILELFAARDAIVVYLADHGEEVFDRGDVFGRIYTEFTPDVANTSSISHS